MPVITLDAVETPAAVVDLDRLERNLSRWQAHCERVGLANRPHIKTHKCVEIARRQVELGAAGLTCQTLHEAETMVAAGFRDILLPYNVLGAARLERLAALLARATVVVSVDDDRLLPGLQRAAADARAELGVLVDCDTGLGRTGVQSPEAAAELGAAVARRTGLRFEGFLTFPTPPGARDFLAAARVLAERAGLAVATVSAGGTPTMWESGRLLPVVSEYRVGLYAFHDRSSVAAGAATLGDVALTVLATVVSRAAPKRAVLDAGSKALSSDRGPDDDFGLVLEAPSSHVVKLNEEHAYLELAAGDELELGQQVRVVTNHACVATNLFEELVIVQGDTVVARWPIARGRSRAG